MSERGIFDASAASETRLAVSEATLWLATDAAAIGIWDLDLVTNVLTWSDRVKAAFGIPAGQPCSMDDFYAGLHPEDFERTAAAFTAAVDPAQRKAYDVEYRTVGREDRIIRWVAARGRGIFDAEGRCVRAVGTAIDITERRAARERLRALDTDLEAQVAERALALGRTWQLSPSLMGTLNSDGSFASANPAWRLLLGWSEAELIQKNWRELVHPDDLERSEAVWRDTVERGVPSIQFENRYRSKSGSWRWLSWVAVAESGKIYFTTRDVTVEREQEAELARAQDALRQSQKIEAIGQLTGGIAHDFANMVQGILGGITLARRRLPPNSTEALGFLDLAATAAERAGALTRRLLAFGRRQPLDPKPVNLGELIGGLRELMQGSVGPEVAVKLDLQKGCWPVHCDPNQLESALLNLAINARDAMMPAGGTVVISTEHIVLNQAATEAWDGVEPGDFVRIAVSDTGIGMTSGVLAHAFEPFFTTKPIGQGTGLGLSQLYGFVRQSHGVVTIESQVGVGTTVYVFLPRGAEPAEEEAPARAEVTSEPAAEHGGAASVLLVEDEVSVRTAAAEALRQAGFSVVEAEDGVRGLDILRQSLRGKDTPGFDLLVADIGLPGGLNGRQLADAARSLMGELPVLLITGYAGDALQGRGRLDRGMELLVKPFSLPTLTERVQSMLRPGACA